MKDIINVFFDKIESLAEYPHFSLDSRKIGKGDVFFAFKGEKVDGHDFIESLLTKEPCWIVGTKDLNHDNYIQVEDIETFLQQVATERRNRLSIPIIGLTGSNAKTTSKELIQMVLKSKYKVYATEGNYNNHLGVPLSILNISPDTEIGIIEMGANHVGEIEFLCSIARPTIGTITNIGTAHIGEFGGFENIVKGKTELYHYLKQNQGRIVFRNDDALLKEQVGNYFYAFSYGESSADMVFHSTNSLMGGLTWNGREVTSHLFGNYNSLNIALAIAYGTIFEVEPDAIITAIEQYNPSSSRSKLIKTPNNELISDAYNANPSSVSLVIDAFKSCEKDNKWLVLGDMKEMGVEKDAQHQNILEKLNEEIKAFEKIILVGEDYFVFREQYPKMDFFLDVKELISEIEKSPLKGKSILLKGSRSIALEKLEAYC